MKSMPHSQVFVDWINRKNIRVKNNSSKGGQEETMRVGDVKSAAYAMALDRYRNGYAPQDIFTKEIEQLVDEACEGVVENVTLSFLNGLDE